MQTILAAQAPSHGNPATVSKPVLTYLWPACSQTDLHPEDIPDPQLQCHSISMWEGLNDSFKAGGTTEAAFILLVPSPVPGNQDLVSLLCGFSCSFSSLSKIHFPHNCCESAN